MDHAARAHSRMSGSTLERRLLCPGSLQAEDGLPDVETPEAAAGTRAHELAEQWLRLGLPPVDMTEEERAGLQFYIEECSRLPGLQSVEQTCSLDGIVPLRNQFSISDFISISASRIYVVDLKWGEGVLVNAERNIQLGAYGLAALNRWFAETACVDMELRIIQPRRQHVSVWELTSDELRAFMHDHVPDLTLALWDSPVRIPGNAQCRFCKAASTCPERHRAAANAVRRAAEEHQKCTLSEKASLLLMEGIVNSCFRQWKEDIKTALLFNHPVPPWHLEPGNRVRSWFNEEFVAWTLGERAYSKPKIISVPEAEKLGLLTDELKSNVNEGRQANRLVAKQ